jgi:AraC-like protein
MNPSGNAPQIQLVARYPRQSRHVLGELETPSVKVQRVRYAPGLCLARHAHDTPHFIYIVDGLHWSGHGCGGDACAPGTVRFLPTGEPHENYIPVGSHCLHVELFLPILALAREDGALLGASGELASPSSPALGARLHHEFRQTDNVSALAVEELLMELLLSGERRSSLRRGPRSLLVAARSGNAL